MYLATIPSYKDDKEEETPEGIDVSELFDKMNHGSTKGK